jgi:hypothetical protein
VAFFFRYREGVVVACDDALHGEFGFFMFVIRGGSGGLVFLQKEGSNLTIEIA